MCGKGLGRGGEEVAVGGGSGGLLNVQEGRRHRAL